MKNINEILNKTVDNVFINPKLSYVEALQQAISNLENNNKVKSKELLKSLNLHY